MTRLRPDEPAASGWTTTEWTQWLADTGAVVSIRPDDDLCQVCATPVGQMYSGDPWPRCWTCNDRGYAEWLDRVVPISFSGSSGLTALIRQAKDEPDRYWVRIGMASLLSSFLSVHRRCLERAAGGPFDRVVPIPSHPMRRNGVDHLRRLHSSITGANAWGGLIWQTDLLTKVIAVNAETSRRQIDADLFAINPAFDVRGERILLVDDLYTSGHTLTSAAACLVNAGARRPLAVTVGRHLRLGDRETDAFLERTQRLQGRGLQLGTCRVHTP